MQSLLNSNAGKKRQQGSGGGKFGMKKKKSSITGGGLGGMVSAMIPGAKVDNKGRIMVNVGTSKETLTFNIGGCMFETYRSTLHRLPNSPLANDKFMKEHYRTDKNDYFFDRDPDIFRATLNYLRTGELHIPSYICGPAAKMELEYWGVMPNKIERCCWTNYNDWNSTLEALNQLDQDRRGTIMSGDEEEDKPKTTWNTYRPKVWSFLETPDSSVWAKIYGFISLLFVMLSIFSFFADTTSEFATYAQTNDITTYLTNYVTAFTSNSSTPEYTTSNDDNLTTLGTTAFSTPTVTSSSTNAPPVEKLIRIKHPALHIIDIVCLIFFTIEYIARFVFSPRKLKFMTSTLGVIDLIAILPDFFSIIIFAARPDLMLNTKTMQVVSFMRFVRVLRIFRLVRHVPGLWILVYTLRASVGELILLSCFMVVGILVFSSLIYFADTRENFESIPHAFWWAIITMTTVGYGDMYPTTTLGKLVGSMCAMSGLLMIGFSVPTLVNNFTLYYKHVQFALQAEKEGSSELGETSAKHWHNADHHKNGSDVISTVAGQQTDKNDNKTENVPLMTLGVELEPKNTDSKIEA